MSYFDESRNTDSTLFRAIEGRIPEDDFKLLLDKNLYILSGRDPRGGGETPMMVAARYGFDGFVSALIKRGAKVDPTDDYGNSALHHARNVHVMRVLTSAGSWVDAVNYAGDTALIRCARRGAIPDMEFLLSCGANTKIRNKEGFTVHDVISSVDRPAYVQRLLGIILEHENNNRDAVRVNALRAAAKAGDTKSLKKMLSAGDIPQEAVDFALYLSATKGHASAVRLLIKNGANPSQEGYDGSLVSQCVRCPEVLAELLSAGADPDARGCGGRTPIMDVAISPGSFDRKKSCKLLLDAGARLDLKDRQGHTFLDHAVESGDLEVMKYAIRISGHKL